MTRRIDHFGRGLLLSGAERLIRRVAHDRPRVSALVVGDADGAVREMVRRYWVEVADIAEVADLQASKTLLVHRPEVVIALDVVDRDPDPAAALARVGRLAVPTLVVGVPREPFGRADGARRAHWTAPAFLRAVSRIGAVADVALPLGWVVAVVRRH